MNENTSEYITIRKKQHPNIVKELEYQRSIHNIRKWSEALDFSIIELQTLREQQKQGLIPKTSAQQDSSWQEIKCDFLIKTPKNQFDCLDKSPPIRVTHPLFSPEICEKCLTVKQYDKVLSDYSLKGKNKVYVAEVIKGLETEKNFAQNQISGLKQHHSQEIDKLNTRIYQLTGDRDIWRTKAQGFQRFADVEKDFSEKRTALENLQVIINERDTAQRETFSLREQNSVLTTEAKNLETDNTALKKELELFKSQPKTYLVLCPDKGSVALNYCLKECPKYADCPMATANYELGKPFLCLPT